jgi:hypothetical protein
MYQYDIQIPRIRPDILQPMADRQLTVFSRRRKPAEFPVDIILFQPASDRLLPLLRRHDLYRRDRLMAGQPLYTIRNDRSVVYLDILFGYVRPQTDTASS